jgi:hypothetical protein
MSKKFNHVQTRRHVCQNWTENISPLFFAVNTVPLDILARKLSFLVGKGHQPRLPLDLTHELYGNNLNEPTPVAVLKRIKLLGDMHKDCLESIHEARRRMVTYADERRRIEFSFMKMVLKSTRAKYLQRKFDTKKWLNLGLTAIIGH